MSDDKKEYKGPFYKGGVYEVEFTGQGVAPSKQENIQLVMRFKPLQMQDPVNKKLTPVEKSYERTTSQAVTANTMAFVPDLLKAIGYAADSFDPFDSKHPKHVSIVGNKCMALCKIEDGRVGTAMEGKKVERWSILSGGGANKPVESNLDAAKKLQTMFGAELKKAMKGFKPADKPAAKPVDTKPVDESPTEDGGDTGYFDADEPAF